MRALFTKRSLVTLVGETRIGLIKRALERLMFPHEVELCGHVYGNHVHVPQCMHSGAPVLITIFVH